MRHEEDDTRPACVLIVQLYRWKASLGAQETPHFGSRRSHYKRRAFLEPQLNLTYNKRLPCACAWARPFWAPALAATASTVTVRHCAPD